jgi:hypothetical protein
MQRGLWLALLIFVLAGCQKQRFEPSPELATPPPAQDVLSLIDSLQMANFFIKNRPNPDVPVAGQAITSPNNPLNNTELEYTDETFMQLGPQLVNPYSIANMTAVYNAYYAINLSTVPATHKYVRFNPANETQIALLDDSLELDLYTHPLDHQMIADGHVYVAAGANIEDIPVLYTVVPNSYTLPAGIPAVVLAPLHLPEGLDELMLCEMAESMALGAQYTGVALNTQTATISRMDVTGANGEHPTYIHHNRPCAPTEEVVDEDWVECPGDWGGGGGGTGPSICGLPGLTCTQAGYPRGRIRVKDTQLGICEPLADVQIRSKNWFRIKSTRTNALGEFFIDKQYADRVKINLIFRNDEVSVRPMRNKAGIRLSLFPITYTLGVYRNMCAANTVDKVFERPLDRETREFEAWLACNAVNAKKTQIEYSTRSDQNLPYFNGHKFILYLQKNGQPYYTGPQGLLLMQSYLFKTRGFVDWAIEVGKIAAYALSKDYFSAAATTLKNVFQSQMPDAIYYYNTHPDNPTRALENLSSNEVNQKFYEIYTSAALLKATNNNVKWKNYYKTYDKIIDAAIGVNILFTKSAYGELMSKPLRLSPESIASLATSFIQHVLSKINAPDREYFEMVSGFSNYLGNVIASEKYGLLADPIFDAKRQLLLSNTSSSHANLLELWRPNNPEDEHRLSRVGLFHDFKDPFTNEIVQPFGVPANNRIDNVFGLTNLNMFQSIVGSGNNIWNSPDQWYQFIDNVGIKNPTQSTAILLFSQSYLIQ